MIAGRSHPATPPDSSRARQKVLCVVGTRPEAIKMAPVIRELVQRSGDFITRVCVTGQHGPMVERVFELFSIPIDDDLKVGSPTGSPAMMAAGILEGLDPLLERDEPDWILVQGDTTTVAAGALAAHYRRIRLGHVEAGLRTWDKWNPFPEEFNRRLASLAADLHFAPTEWSRANLLREAVPGAAILVTGNPVIDALKWAASQEPSPRAQLLLRRWEGNRAAKILLVTAHRRESWGRSLSQICEALRSLALRSPGQVQIVFPVHPNPQVHDLVHRELGDLEHITLTPPLEYDELVPVLKRAYLVLTDSGGLQEEAPALGKPVLVLREVTERPEGVEAGTVRVVGTDPPRIVAETCRLLDDPFAYGKMARAVNPYGDGQAARRIVDGLEKARRPAGGRARERVSAPDSSLAPLALA